MACGYDPQPVDLATEPELPRLWPVGDSVTWPTAVGTDDPTFEQMASGKALWVLHPGVRLEPFKPVTDLPPSTADGSSVRQPVPCGKHFIYFPYFPGALAMEAMSLGKRYAFVTMCECSIANLVILEQEGAHFRNDGTLEEMAEVDRPARRPRV